MLYKIPTFLILLWKVFFQSYCPSKSQKGNIVWTKLETGEVFWERLMYCSFWCKLFSSGCDMSFQSCSAYSWKLFKWNSHGFCFEIYLFRIDSWDKLVLSLQKIFVLNKISVSNFAHTICMFIYYYLSNLFKTLYSRIFNLICGKYLVS